MKAMYRDYRAHKTNSPNEEVRATKTILITIGSSVLHKVQSLHISSILTMRFLLLVQLFGLFAAVFGFQRQSFSVRPSSKSLSMATTESSLKNLSRKLKRNIRSADASTFSNLLNPVNDKYLKSDCPGNTYVRILKNLKKKAKQLKVTITPGFGEKAKIVAPTIIETATSAGTFTVSK